MMLTKEQIDWINQEKEILKRVIDAKNRSKTHSGILRDYALLDSINTIIALHNVAMTKHKADLKAEEEERQARVEKGKERLKDLKSDSTDV